MYIVVRGGRPEWLQLHEALQSILEKQTDKSATVILSPEYGTGQQALCIARFVRMGVNHPVVRAFLRELSGSSYLTLSQLSESFELLASQRRGHVVGLQSSRPVPNKVLAKLRAQ